MTCLINF